MSFIQPQQNVYSVLFLPRLPGMAQFPLVNDGNRQLDNTLLHELGHSFGMQHTMPQPMQTGLNINETNWPGKSFSNGNYPKTWDLDQNGHNRYNGGLDLGKDNPGQGSAIGVSGLDLFPLNSKHPIRYDFWEMAQDAKGASNSYSYPTLKFDLMGYTTHPWVSDYTFVRLWKGGLSTGLGLSGKTNLAVQHLEFYDPNAAVEPTLWDESVIGKTEIGARRKVNGVVQGYTYRLVGAVMANIWPVRFDLENFKKNCSLAGSDSILSSSGDYTAGSKCVTDIVECEEYASQREPERGMVEINLFQRERSVSPP